MQNINKVLNRKKIFIYLVIITSLSIAWYLYSKSHWYNDLPRKINHLLKAFLLLTISGIGYLPFRKMKMNWTIQLWTLFHIATILIIFLFGIWDWMMGRSNLMSRSFAEGLFKFVASPVPFLVMVFLVNNSSLKTKRDIEG